MYFRRIFRSIAVAGFGLMLLFTAQAVFAQNSTQQYREWQQAQRRAQDEYRDYLRTRSSRDYRNWQIAQQRAQQEYREYQYASQYGNRNYDNRYSNRYYDNRYDNRTVNRYRIYRGGNYYTIDQRQYQLLQNAVNQGYRQGYNAGSRDRRYGYGDNYYYNDRVYRAGTYGYQSYVTRDMYQYYFQQGFQRGYQDGYNTTYRYGYRTNNGLNILGNVISSILQIVD